jgi:hypothetical protein
MRNRLVFPVFAFHVITYQQRAAESTNRVAQASSYKEHLRRSGARLAAACRAPPTGWGAAVVS